MILGCVNSKGGVGKTTLSLGLAEHLARSGQRVLLIDADPQASASDRCRRIKLSQEIPFEIDSSTEHDRLMQEADDRGEDFDEGAIEAAAAAEIEKRISRTLRRAASYDHVILDGPPAAGRLQQAIIRASDFVLIPVTPDAMSARAAKRLVRSIRSAAQAGKNLEAAMVLNRADTRQTATRLAPQVTAQHGIALLNTQIPNAAASNNADLYSTLLGDMGSGSNAFMEAIASMVDEIEMER